VILSLEEGNLTFVLNNLNYEELSWLLIQAKIEAYFEEEAHISFLFKQLDDEVYLVLG